MHIVGCILCALKDRFLDLLVFKATNVFSLHNYPSDDSDQITNTELWLKRILLKFIHFRFECICHLTFFFFFFIYFYLFLEFQCHVKLWIWSWTSKWDLSNIHTAPICLLILWWCIWSLMEAYEEAMYVFDKVFASLWHLTRKNLHKNEMHINWHETTIVWTSPISSLLVEPTWLPTTRTFLFRCLHHLTNP